MRNILNKLISELINLINRQTNFQSNISQNTFCVFLIN